MNKKYTVFLSSTFDDLREERNEVIHALLELDCIPCSMEYFPADDDGQFEFIKSVIDECDYYILILAGRYGSIGKNGKSFTEMEYRYAKQLGIPVLAFIHSDLGTISLDKSEKDGTNREKLETFIKYVSTGKLVKYWNGKEDLAGKVSRTMISVIQRHPSKGWIRGDNDVDNMDKFPSIFADKNMEMNEKHMYLFDEMYNLAIYYKNLNEIEKSRIFFEGCLILDSNNVDALREYGGLYYDNRYYKKASFFWEKLLNIQKSSRNYCLYALVCYGLSEYSKAKEFCKHALEYPDDGSYDYVYNLLKKRNV